jgi:ParB family chromosome partitioning protein
MAMAGGEQCGFKEYGMSKIARRLGRGLDSLVSNLRSDADEPLPGALVAERPADAALPAKDVRDEAAAINAAMVAVDALTPNPFQPRDLINDDNIVSIATSIRRHGLLQPISARVVAGQYQIIAGERRWRAAKSIGMTHVPVIVRQAADQQMLELALIENLQREDLNAMDRGRAYRQFCTHFGLKPEEVADRLGEDRTTVVNYLRLLELAEPIRTMVAAGKLTMGHARCLLGVENETHRLRLAEAMVANELSVRAAEEIVRRGRALQAGATVMALAEGGALLQSSGTRRGRLRSAHLRDLEQRFERAVKTKVTIHEGRKRGSGRITIEYFSLDDFDRIAGMLGVEGE